jgi:hypothetical protein
MDPFSGNAAIGYARLNVPDGQKKMWEQPWASEHLAKRPWIDGIDLAQNVDCLRGVWDEQKKTLIVTLRTWNGVKVNVEPCVRKAVEVEEFGSLTAATTVAADEIDIVFAKVKV